MRFTLSMLGYALAGGLLFAIPAAAYWHTPYVNQHTSGSWTDVEYDDGVCKYYYAHNDYDNETKINRYGDCSGVAIGPGGAAVPVYPAPPPY